MEKIELIKSAALFISLITFTLLMIIFFQPKKDKKNPKIKNNEKINELTRRLSDYNHKLDWNLDPATKERLIQYEMKKTPSLNREKAEEWAKERYENDNR